MQHTAISPQRWLPALLLLGLGTAGVAAAWTLLALALQRQCAWMAFIAAIDAIFLLRYARMRPGIVSALWALAATAIAIALANWWIAAAQLAASVGMLPWEGISRVGWHHAWIVADLANGQTNLLIYALALLLAAGVSIRPMPWNGTTRQSPDGAVDHVGRAIPDHSNT